MPAPHIPSLAATAPLHTVAFRAMGCGMQAWVLTDDASLAEERLTLVRTWMALVDATLSRFRPDSELSRLNARAGLATPVSSLLWDALSWALTAAQATQGVYDPTVLDALVAAGYDRDFDEIRAMDDGGFAEVWLHPGSPSDVRQPVDRWQTLDLDGRHRTVTLPPGLRLDLGGTAKGWAAARAAEMLAPMGPCLVDAGGDLAVRGGLPDTPGWSIGVEAPGCDAGPFSTLVVRDRGVATSGVNIRRWVNDGVTRHHIIDPQTRGPAATDLQTATIIAPDVAWADLHALVVMVLGCRAGLAYLEAHADLEGVLVDRGGHAWPTSGMATYLREPC